MQNTKTKGASGGQHWRATYTMSGSMSQETRRTSSETGEQWQISSDATLEHCGVVVSAKHVAAKTARPAGKESNRCTQVWTGQTETIVGSMTVRVAISQGHTTPRWKDGVNAGTGKTRIGETLAQYAALTLNVGGSREALILAMETDAGILTLSKSTACWHGMWGAATAIGSGRNGGTAVLARRPVQNMRRGGGVAVVGWTHRSRLYATSTYTSHEGDVGHEETRGVLNNGKPTSRR